MNDTRKAPTREATRAEAMVENGFCEARSSCVNSNTNRGEAQATIFDLLPVGEANAIRTKQLVKVVGAASIRDLQLKIAAERERQVDSVNVQGLRRILQAEQWPRRTR